MDLLKIHMDSSKQYSDLRNNLLDSINKDHDNYMNNLKEKREQSYRYEEEKKQAESQHFYNTHEFVMPKPGICDYLTGEENHIMFRDPSFGKWVKK
jgi:hypothetical protein